MKHFRSREEAVRELKRRLQKDGTPRRDMLLIVLVTGTSGFWISYMLLLAGVSQMWLRYPMAVAIAYGVFIGMLRLWLRRTRRGPARNQGDGAGLDLVPDLPFGGGGNLSSAHPFGGGGGFGGSGTGRVWEAAGVPKAPNATSVSKSTGKGLDVGFDLDDGVLLVLPVLIVLSVVILGLYLAPVIFAEILLDGALMAGLYRQFKHVPTQHWLRTCFAKTAWLFGVTAVLLGIAGLIIQSTYPHAVSIGVLWDTVIR